MNFGKQSHYTRTKTDQGIIYQVYQTGASKRLLLMAIFMCLMSLTMIGLSLWMVGFGLLIAGFFLYFTLKWAANRAKPKRIELSAGAITAQGQSHNIKDIEALRYGHHNDGEVMEYYSHSGAIQGMQNQKRQIAERNLTLWMRLTSDSRPIEIVDGLTADTADDLMNAILKDMQHG